MGTRLDQRSLTPAIVICGLGLGVVLMRLARWLQHVDDAHVDLE